MLRKAGAPIDEAIETLPRRAAANPIFKYWLTIRQSNLSEALKLAQKRSVVIG